MSHVTTGSICITNLKDLEHAVKRLGGTLVEGQKTHRWFGKFMDDWQQSGGKAAVERGFDPKTFGTCEHAIRIHDHNERSYEIGVVNRSDGKGFDLIWDVWGTEGKKITAAFGPDASFLKNEIGIAATQRAYRGKRVVVKRHSREKATVRVYA